MLPQNLIAEIKHLELKAKRLATDTLSGDYASAFHGRGMEFQEVREYVPGDDVRAIDWNVTARTSIPHIKVYREERELTVMIVVDVSSSVRTGHTRSRMAASVELASVLAWLSLRNNDRVGLVLFSDRVEHFLEPRKGRGHVWRVIKDLFTFEAKGKGTNLGLALDHVQKILKRRASVFVMSDFWGADFQKSLKQCAQKHDLTCVNIKDPVSDELPDAGLVRWTDSETGEMLLLDTSDPIVRGAYASSQRQRKDRFHKMFREAGADHFEITTSASVVPPLAAFLQGHNHAKRESVLGGLK